MEALETEEEEIGHLIEFNIELQFLYKVRDNIENLEAADLKEVEMMHPELLECSYTDLSREEEILYKKSFFNLPKREQIEFAKLRRENGFGNTEFEKNVINNNKE